LDFFDLVVVREDYRIALALQLKDFLNEINAECGH
jgi:hypothetical protein